MFRLRAARVFFSSVFVFLCFSSSSTASGAAATPYGEWRSATATYFQQVPAGGAPDGGACGYGDMFSRRSAAVSGVLFSRGRACGGCYELRCVDHILWCRPGSPSATVTAGDFCPPNYGLTGDSGGWCNFPREHFQLPALSFFAIAEEAADVIPVQYRRVDCERRGGLRFTMSGSWSAAFYQVLIWNVGLDGEVAAVKVKGTRTGWIPMARNWGQNWHCAAALAGQPLSFEVTTAGGRTLTAYNVAPADWKPGQTFDGKKQFH